MDEEAEKVFDNVVDETKLPDSKFQQEICQSIDDDDMLVHPNWSLNSEATCTKVSRVREDQSDWKQIRGKTSFTGDCYFGEICSLGHAWFPSKEICDEPKTKSGTKLKNDGEEKQFKSSNLTGSHRRVSGSGYLPDCYLGEVCQLGNPWKINSSMKASNISQPKRTDHENLSGEKSDRRAAEKESTKAESDQWSRK